MRILIQAVGSGVLYIVMHGCPDKHCLKLVSKQFAEKEQNTNCKHAFWIILYVSTLLQILREVWSEM